MFSSHFLGCQNQTQYFRSCVGGSFLSFIVEENKKTVQLLSVHARGVRGYTALMEDRWKGVQCSMCRCVLKLSREMIIKMIEMITLGFLRNGRRKSFHSSFCLRFDHGLFFFEIRIIVTSTSPQSTHFNEETFERVKLAVCVSSDEEFSDFLT